jgi:hypothetical protein
MITPFKVKSRILHYKKRKKSSLYVHCAEFYNNFVISIKLKDFAFYGQKI